MRTATRYTLRAIELDYLLTLANPGNRLLALWRIIVGAESFDTAPTIDPSAYAIPHAQALRIMEPIGVSWINIGPGTFGG